jgi:hypothetical protein
MTTKPAPPDGDLTELVVTIALLNDEAELALMASSTGWTPYYRNSEARDGGCKHIVNPRYLR